MKEKIEEISNQIDVFTVENLNHLEEYRISFIGSKGKIKDLFQDLKQVPNDQKKSFGQLLNELRVKAETRFESLKLALEESTTTSERIDFSRPGENSSVGSHHPISLVR